MISFKVMLSCKSVGVRMAFVLHLGGQSFRQMAPSLISTHMHNPLLIRVTYASTVYSDPNFLIVIYPGLR